VSVWDVDIVLVEVRSDGSVRQYCSHYRLPLRPVDGSDTVTHDRSL
jgi:hypothetical protein